MAPVLACRAMPGSDDRDSSKCVIIWEQGLMIYWSVVSADDIDITLTLNGVVVQKERFADRDNAMAFVIDQMLAYRVRVH
ncbi:MAG TPA: hypothetical protein VGG73_15080 [Vicinamibacterales bacterium]